MKRIGIGLLLFITIFLNINSVDAKASNKANENFANIVFFAYFDGTESEINTDIKYYKDNSTNLINHYNGDYKRSLTNYLKEISYGKFNVINIFPQLNNGVIEPLKLNSNIASAYARNIDTDIIEQLLSQYPNIGNYVVDYNNDGYIDNITVIIKTRDGYTAKEQSSFVSHKSSYPITRSYMNKYVSTYNIIGTKSIENDKSGVIAHEFLHSIGYPDLYRNSSATDHPVYVWDIMASANFGMSYPLAYLRSKISGWLDIETITTNKTLRLDLQSNKDGNQAYILKSPLNEYEFFVVEFRKKDTSVSDNILDRFIGGSGVIVYRIDTTVTGLSNFFGQTGVYVFRPNEGANEQVKANNAYLSVESGRTSIGSSNMNHGINDGALTFSDGSNSGIVIKNISSSKGDYMTLDVEIPDAKDYDLWNNTGLTDLTGEGYAKTVNLVLHNNKPYVITNNNNKVYIQALENGTWVSKNSNTTLNSSYYTDIHVMEFNNEIYLAYSNGSKLELLKYNDSNNTWTTVNTINNPINSFGMNIINNKLYITALSTSTGNMQSGYFDTIYLYTYSNNTLTLLGSDTVKDGGQPKVLSMNNKIYITTRDADGTIEFFLFENNKFNKITTSFKSYAYDVKVLNNKMYFVLGQTTIEKLKLYIYDGTNWSNINTTYDALNPSLITSGGNLYILAKVDNNMNLYSLNEKTNEIKKEGHTVDTSSDPLDSTLISNNNTIYIGMISSTDKKIVVKAKETINKLLSLSITPPKKTSYKKGETLDKTGLRVLANYTLEQKEVTNYTITGFNTNNIGIYNATITYEGVSNTFSYEVFEDINVLESIKVTAPNKLKYRVGEKLDLTGLKVIAKYTNEEKEITNYTITGFDSSIPGKRNLTISYNGKSINIEYEVVYDYNIYYNLNGGTNNNANPSGYNKANNTITLKNPTKVGYTFKGWYSDSKYKKKVTSIKKNSTGNKTLYAKWSVNTYNIKFKANGGKGTTSTMKNKKYSTTYTLNKNKFTRKGYTFIGWNTKSDGSGTSYTNKQKISRLTSKNKGTVTLYAIWRKNTYTINYKLNGGNIGDVNPTTYTVTTSTIKLKNPTKEGYTFKGWYSDSKYKKKVTSIKKGSTGNKTLYAKWSVNTYNIKFKANGGKGTTSTMKNKKYSTTYTLNKNKFTRKGYTFIGWNTKSDGSGTSYTNKQKISRLTSKNKGTITLYAMWEKV